jgi:hypothetical protein
VNEATDRWSRLRRWGPARFGGRPRMSGRPPSANGASSLHLAWDVPTDEQLIEASVTLLVPVLPRVPRLYFWALQVCFSGGAGAHLGLQWAADPPRKLRHVNWGGYGTSGSELSGNISTRPVRSPTPIRVTSTGSPATPIGSGSLGRLTAGPDGWTRLWSVASTLLEKPSRIRWSGPRYLHNATIQRYRSVGQDSRWSLAAADVFLSTRL